MICSQSIKYLGGKQTEKPLLYALHKNNNPNILIRIFKIKPGQGGVDTKSQTFLIARKALSYIKLNLLEESVNFASVETYAVKNVEHSIL